MDNFGVKTDFLILALVQKEFSDRTLIFMKTKLGCDRMEAILAMLGVKTAKLHGGVTQHSRIEALEQFRNAEVSVLCCTDVAARGLDIAGIKTVCFEQVI